MNVQPLMCLSAAFSLSKVSNYLIVTKPETIIMHMHSYSTETYMVLLK